MIRPKRTALTYITQPQPGSYGFAVLVGAGPQMGNTVGREIDFRPGSLHRDDFRSSRLRRTGRSAR